MCGQSTQHPINRKRLCEQPSALCRFLWWRKGGSLCQPTRSSQQKATWVLCRCMCIRVTIPFVVFWLHSFQKFTHASSHDLLVCSTIKWKQKIVLCLKPGELIIRRRYINIKRRFLCGAGELDYLISAELWTNNCLCITVKKLAPYLKQA